jgi:hypothetical protein
VTDAGAAAGSYYGPMGILIFSTPEEALRAGFMIESPIADGEGFLHARIRTSTGWGRALIRTKVSNNGR